MVVDHLTLLYSLLGGFFMGSYPVPIKTPAVLEVDPHPLVFQLYKSFWVFASSWILVIARGIARGHLRFDFTWWAVVSAAAWIPSGLGTIAAVPRLGVGMTVVTAAGLSSVLSFLVFWLVLGESMREYGPAGHRFSLAPAYLVCVLLGMAGLVAAPRAAGGLLGARGRGGGPLSAPSGAEARGVEAPQLPPPADCRRPAAAAGGGRPAPSVVGRGVEDHPVPMESSSDPGSCGEEVPLAAAVEQRRVAGSGVAARPAADGSPLPGEQPAGGAQAVGLLCALLAGLFSATQYAAVTLGRRHEEAGDGCSGSPEACSEALKERFNQFGSWMASFGIGAMLVTIVYALLFSMVSQPRGKPLPSMHFSVLLWPGSLAGILWTLGNIFQTAALQRGGNAVMMASNQSIQLITSGAWGLLYYREVKDCLGSACWVASAAWTLAFMLLLSHEKVGG